MGYLTLLILFGLYLFIFKFLPWIISEILAKILNSKVEFIVDIFRWKISQFSIKNVDFYLEISDMKLVPLRKRVISISIQSLKMEFYSGNDDDDDDNFSISASSSENKKKSVFPLIMGGFLKRLCGFFSISINEVTINQLKFLTEISEIKVDFHHQLETFDTAINCQKIKITLNENNYIQWNFQTHVSVLNLDNSITTLKMNISEPNINLTLDILDKLRKNPSTNNYNTNETTTTKLDKFKSLFSSSSKVSTSISDVHVSLIDLGLKIKLHRCDFDKDELINLSVLNIDVENIFQLQSIQINSTVSDIYKIKVNCVYLDNLEEIIRMKNLITKRKDKKPIENNKNKIIPSISYDMSVTNIQIGKRSESSFTVYLPSLDWICADTKVHSINFDYMSANYDQLEICLIRDISIYYDEEFMFTFGNFNSNLNEDVIINMNNTLKSIRSNSNAKTSETPKLPKITVKIFEIRMTYHLMLKLSFVCNFYNLVVLKEKEKENSVFLDSCQVFFKNNEMDKILQFEDCSFTKKDSIINGNVKKNIEAVWKPNIHMALNEILSTLNQVKTKSENNNPPTEIKLTMKLSITKMEITLQTHVLYVTIPSCNVEFKSGLTKVLFPSGITVDTKDNPKLFYYSALMIKYHSVPTCSRYRDEIEDVANLKNRALEILVNTFEINFSHDYDFYDLFFNEILRIYKWLKKLHLKNKKSGNIPPDIIFCVKQFVLEFQDDPFEVRLKENYDLMEDEHLESEKRKNVLEAKIDELKKSHIMLTGEKVDKLFSDLDIRNTSIYVQRALNYHDKSSSKKSKLVTVSLSTLELMIFSDSSMMGDRIFDHFIENTDAESPWPEKLEFSSKILRWIRVEFKYLTCFLRDFPQPLADFRHILLWGKIGLADEVPADRSQRKQKIHIGEPFEDAEIIRSLTSMKIYHDIAVDIKSLSVAHGPCWEPVLSQLSISLNNIFGNSTDPSPPMPWWDKIRFLFHGRILASSKSMKFMLHTSPDPYNTTEEIELTLEDSSIHWSNDGLLNVNGDMDLFIRTASKYDDCQLFHIPGLFLTIKFDWVCLGNPHDHHSVIPCAPDKVPEYSHNVAHDSYRAFRSINLNTRINIDGGKNSRKNRRPLVHMFSSTIRWMESLKWLFSGASRPIRRGSVFGKPPTPRKPSFFRHLKRIHLSLLARQLQLDYWTSASMTKGFIMNIAQGISLAAELNLKLVDVKDGLKHRQRSEWSTIYLNSELSTADIWFQIATKNPENDERFLEKSFFFSVENVKYSREISTPNEVFGILDGRFPSHSIIVIGARGAWTESNRDMCFSLYDSWRRANVLRNQVNSECLKGFNLHNTGIQEEDHRLNNISTTSTNMSKVLNKVFFFIILNDYFIII